MPKDTEVVNPEPQIEAELPDPQISGPPAGQPLDQAGAPSVDLKSLRDMVREELQSVKDTRIGKSETRLDSLEAAIAQYEVEKGGTVDKKALSKLQGTQREKELLSRLEALEGGKVPEASPGGGEKGWKETRAKTLSDAGIEGSDSRFVEFMKQEFTSHDDMNEKLFKATEGWSFTDEQKPKPDASTIAQVIPAVTAVGDDFEGISDDALGEKQIELMKDYSNNEPEIKLIDAVLARRAKKNKE